MLWNRLRSHQSQMAFLDWLVERFQWWFLATYFHKICTQNMISFEGIDRLNKCRYQLTVFIAKTLSTWIYFGQKVFVAVGFLGILLRLIPILFSERQLLLLLIEIIKWKWICFFGSSIHTGKWIELNWSKLKNLFYVQKFGEYFIFNNFRFFVMFLSL